MIREIAKEVAYTVCKEVVKFALAWTVVIAVGTYIDKQINKNY